MNGRTGLEWKGTGITPAELQLLTRPALAEMVKWFCPKCTAARGDPLAKAMVGAAGERRKERPSDKAQRQWGGGASCAGLRRVNTVVSKHHVGSVPGVPVGTFWMGRINLSEARVHPPPVAGMHGCVLPTTPRPTLA